MRALVLALALARSLAAFDLPPPGDYSCLCPQGEWTPDADFHSVSCGGIAYVHVTQKYPDTEYPTCEDKVNAIKALPESCVAGKDDDWLDETSARAACDKADKSLCQAAKYTKSDGTEDACRWDEPSAVLPQFAMNCCGELPNSAKCTICADGSAPLNGDVMLGDHSCSAINAMISQSIAKDDPACAAYQAYRGMCGCPGSATSPGSDGGATCTLCKDGSDPTKPDAMLGDASCADVATHAKMFAPDAPECATYQNYGGICGCADADPNPPVAVPRNT